MKEVGRKQRGKGWDRQMERMSERKKEQKLRLKTKRVNIQQEDTLLCRGERGEERREETRKK